MHSSVLLPWHVGSGVRAGKITVFQYPPSPARAISELMQILAASPIATLRSSASLSRKSRISLEILSERLSPSLSLLRLLIRYLHPISLKFIGIHSLFRQITYNLSENINLIQIKCTEGYINNIRAYTENMLTQNQKEAFKKIKEKVSVEDGGLNAKQKGDFYYRMSKILKDELEGLNDLVFLMNELPDSYLEKIDLNETAKSAMKLTEELIKKLNPPQIRAKQLKNKKVGYVAVKNFILGPFNEKYYYKDEDGEQELTSIGYSLVRDLTKEEEELIYNLTWHIDDLRTLIQPQRITLENCTLEEFLTKELPTLIEEAKSKGVKYQVAPDQLDLAPLQPDEVINVGRLKRQGSAEESK